MHHSNMFCTKSSCVMLEDLCCERRVVLLLPMSEGLGTLGDWANVLAFFKKAFFALGDLVFFLIFLLP